MEIHEIDITDGLNKAMFEKLEEENKRLKEQLHCANGIISFVSLWKIDKLKDLADDYLKEWNV